MSLEGRDSIVEKEVPSAQFVAGGIFEIKTLFKSYTLLSVNRYICRAQSNTGGGAAISV